MKLQVKRVLALALAAVLALLMTACGEKTDPAPETAAQASAAETNAPAQDGTDPAADDTAIYRTEFAQQLAAMRTEYGVPQGEIARQSGVSFADLLDWDGDGTPELFTLTHKSSDENEGTFRLEVWSAADAAADVAVVRLLNTVVGSSYGFLGSDLDFYLMRSDSGDLTLCVDDSHELADLKETYYTFSAGTVQTTVLSAQSSVGGWTEDADPVDPDAYQIDGAACDKTTFDAQRSALGRDDCLQVECHRNYDSGALDAFLTGQSDAYAGGALQQAADLADPQPQWLQDALFTFGG